MIQKNAKDKEETEACSSAFIKTTDDHLSVVESLNKASVQLKEDAGNLGSTVNIFTVN